LKLGQLNLTGKISHCYFFGASMNITTNLQSELSKTGWEKFTYSSTYLDEGFDIVASRRNIARNTWHLLVKAEPILDVETALIWHSKFVSIKEKSQPGFLSFGSPFILCLIVSKLWFDALDILKCDEFGVDPMAVGLIMIGDLHNHTAHGAVPIRPRDAHQYGNELKGILKKLM
jgi:hypothetical protein